MTEGQTESIQLALRPREAAAALGVSERTLWTWTRNGEVPCVKLGSTVMYPVRELERWLSERASTERPEIGSA